MKVKVHGTPHQTTKFHVDVAEDKSDVDREERGVVVDDEAATFWQILEPVHLATCHDTSKCRRLDSLLSESLINCLLILTT